MGIANYMGLGRDRLIARGRAAQGVVTGTRTLWWCKVNTKPVRRHLADGARFPHSVSFRYTVDGQTYTARTVLGWYAWCPGVGEAVRVYYAPDRPERCALRSEDFLRL